MNMPRDYFSILGLSPAFDIEAADLKKRYFSAQRAFHPDRLVGKGPQDRRLAISHSMLLNSAYETLKSPLRRAQYLLFLKNMPVAAAKPSPELLMEIMELREHVAEIASAEAVASLEMKVIHEKGGIIKHISEAFRDEDAERARELTIRLSYLEKLVDEIRVKKKMIGQ